MASATSIFGEPGAEKMAHMIRRLIASRRLGKTGNILRIMGAIFLTVSERSYIYGKEINHQNWGN